MINRRELLKTTIAGTAALALPSLSIAQEKKAEAFYTLPKLPYAFDALEPHIDAKTMEIHHDRHHKGYVDNLNKFIAGTPLAGKPIEEVLANLSKLDEKVRTAVRNNGGGHFNHSMFWKWMSPKGGKPAGALNDAIANAFVDLDGMLKQLKEAAMAQFGSGWAWVVASKEGKLSVTKTPNQDNALMTGTGMPILGVDVWEHAYYLKHQNLRAKYLEDFVKVINWEFVGECYEGAKKA
jgi:Fe-Mn family superoxide dismutase